MLEELKREIKEVTKLGKKTILSLSTTSKKSLQYVRVPNRKFQNYLSFGIVVHNKNEAWKIINELDGVVDIFLIDVEMKQDIDLMSQASLYAEKTKLIAYKPNDTTLESIDLFIRNHYNDKLLNKKVLIYGSGNLGAKCALRFAERGANVYLYGRNHDKVRAIVDGLNFILPKFNHHSIKQITSFIDIRDFNLLISLVSADRVLGSEIISCLSDDALVVDIGINNFSEDFYQSIGSKNLQIWRLDVRIGFPYTLNSIFDEVQDFFRFTIGKKSIGSINIVSGGYIGNKGDIIVDSINRPEQIIGVANGIGGLLSESEYSDKIKEHIISVNKAILKQKT